MPRYRAFWTASRHRLALTLLGSLLGLALARAAEQGKRTDPFPIRRQIISAERLANELKRTGNDVLVRLGRDEFERLVSEAATRTRGNQEPRLIEARYRANLVEGADQTSGLSGTAQWKVVYTGKGPALLRLGDPSGAMNLAVSKPRFDNRDAVLSSFPDPEREKNGTSLALRLDGPGAQTLTLDWLARADQRPEGLVVDLRVPPSPAASLEVELPENRTLDVLDRPSAAGRAAEPQAIVSGPHAAEAGNRRLWRVACGGRSQLTLLLRRTQSGSVPVVLSWQKTVQRLSPDGLESATTFTVESLQQGIRELVCDLHPSLRPVAVTAANLDCTWQVDPPNGHRLRISLSQPLREGSVEVRCLAPLASVAGGRSSGKALLVPWTSPGLRLEGVIARGEMLQVWLHPELRLLSWEPGDFRLIDSALVSDTEKKTAAVGKWRRLTLQGGGIAPVGGQPRRPGGTVQAGGVEYLVAQQMWWRMQADGMELTARLECQVRQGQLFEIPLRLPAGWDAEAVELDRADNLRGWKVRGDVDAQTLLVDLNRPWVARAQGGSASDADVLTVRLRLRDSAAAVGRLLPFPDVVPLGARLRTGGLGFHHDERLYHALIQTTLPQSRTIPAGPWGQNEPDHYFPFQGDTLIGTLKLDPRPPRVHAVCQAEALVQTDVFTFEERLRLEAETGAPAAIDLFIADAGEGPEPIWQWQGRTGSSPGPFLRRVVRRYDLEAGAGLAALGGGSVLQSLCLQAVRPRGSFWRIELDRPLRVHEPLTLVARLVRTPSAAAGGQWSVPLISVRGAGTFTGELTLLASGAEVVGSNSSGLRESGTSASGGRGYHWSDPQAWLSVQTRRLSSNQPAGAVIDRACMTSVLTLQGESRHHLRFRVARWSQRRLPVRLPADARLLAAAVDGRWLEPTALIDAAKIAHLPVPAGQDSTRIELLYATAAPSFAIGQALPAALPDLPVGWVDFRRRWLLPPGVEPLGRGSLVPLPGDVRVATRSLPSRLLEFIRLGSSDSLGAGFALPGGESVFGGRDTSMQVQQQALIDAFAALRKYRGGRKVSLEVVLEDLVGGYLQQRCPLLVDHYALRQGGFTPTSKLSIQGSASDGSGRSMPWRESDLIVLPCRVGAVVTTATELARWEDSLPDAVDAQLADAATAGADDSGRFVSAVHWLAQESTLPPGLFEPGSEWEGWSAWLARGGEAEDGPVWVVRRSAATAGGLLLACLLSLLLFLRQSASRGVLLVWLGVSGLAIAWLPEPLADLAWLPLITGLLAAMGVYLVWATGWAGSPRATNLTPSRRGLLGAGLAAVALICWTLVSHAQPAQPPTVYLIAASGQTKASVLAPASLLARLREMGQPTTVDRTVLLSSEATGRVVDGNAQISVVFMAQSFTDKPSTLVLPLEGVALTGDVLLDGVRVLPETRLKPVAGYAIRLRGEGRHKVELAFQVPVSGRTAEKGENGSRQVSFRLPALVQSRLVFQLPAGAANGQVPVRGGTSRLVADAKGPRLEADLGALTTPVVVRWTQGGKSGKPARVMVRQAHLWDLRAEASLLTTLLRYTISENAVSSLDVAIPRDLEVRSAQARRPTRSRSVGPPVAEPAARLSDWRVVNAGPDRSRTLKLEFPGPVSGDVEVTLELVPLHPWSGSSKQPRGEQAASVLLPLPRPLGVTPSKEVAYLACRSEGVDARRIDWLRLNGIKPADFAPFWPESTRPAPASLEYPSTFQGDASQPPELRLHLRPKLGQVKATQDVRLQVGPAQAEWQATVNFTSPDKNLSLAQWNITSSRPVTISSVSGVGVSRWVQSGSRLTVWFDKTTDAARVELAGWVSLETTGAPGRGPAQPQLHLPCFRPLAAAQVETRLRLSATANAVVTPLGNLRNLQREGSPAGTIAYRTSQPDYGGNFLVKPGPEATAEITTNVRLDGQEVVFQSDVEVRANATPRTLAVRMLGWQGDAWLDVREGAVTGRRDQHRRQSGQRERLWTLDRAEDAQGRLRLRLTGRAALEEAGEGVEVPEIALPGVQTRHVLVIDAGLIAEAGRGFDPVAAPAGSPVGARAWLVRGLGQPASTTSPEGDFGRVRVIPREQPRPPTVEVVLAEKHARLADGRRWLHEYRCWVRHEGPAEVSVRWREPVEVVSVAAGPADGSVLPVNRPLGPDRQTLWLPLPESPAIHAIVIRYRHLPVALKQGRESAQQPDRNAPTVAGADGSRMLWTVDVPVGWNLVGGKDHAVSGATRQTLMSLARASGFMAVCRERLGQQDAAAEYNRARRRLNRLLRLAELGLKAGGDGSLPLGPSGQTLQSWFDHEARQAKTLPAASPGEAEQEGSDIDLESVGRAVSWASEARQTAPAWRLEPTQYRDWRTAVTFSLQWLALLGVAFVVAASGVLRKVAQWLWPEQVVVLGLTGWWFAGPALLLCTLLVLGVTGRALILVRGLRSLLSRPTGQNPTGHRADP